MDSNLYNVLQVLGIFGCGTLVLTMVALIMHIVKQFMGATPKVHVVLDVDREKVTPKTAEKIEESAAPVPPEPPRDPEPGPELPPLDDEGKMLITCKKCKSDYRVYPNREWYTCTKCSTKMYLFKK